VRVRACMFVWALIVAGAATRCVRARAGVLARACASACTYRRDAATRRRDADAVVGVAFFSDTAALDFGRFDRAFVGLYRILGGESWFESLDEVLSLSLSLSLSLYLSLSLSLSLSCLSLTLSFSYLSCL
jgi:hypothetical protein